MMYAEANFIFGMLRVLVMIMSIPAAIYALYLLRKISKK